jgi:hypothetical protein
MAHSIATDFAFMGSDIDIHFDLDSDGAPVDVTVTCDGYLYGRYDSPPTTLADDVASEFDRMTAGDAAVWNDVERAIAAEWRTLETSAHAR